MGPKILNNTVDSIMTKDRQTVTSKVLVSDALDLINQLGIQGLFVSDNDNKPVGFVHFHDLIRIMKG